MMALGQCGGDAGDDGGQSMWPARTAYVAESYGPVNHAQTNLLLTGASIPTDCMCPAATARAPLLVPGWLAVSRRGSSYSRHSTQPVRVCRALHRWASGCFPQRRITWHKLAGRVLSRDTMQSPVLPGASFSSALLGCWQVLSSGLRPALAYLLLAVDRAARHGI